MAEVHRASPILPVRDVEQVLSFYAGLGFQTRRFSADHQYGFATWDGVEIHLGEVRSGIEHVPASAYLFVEDADDLARRWQAAGADVREPEDTEWGKHEGVLIDLDGNHIRFGSPIRLG